jgi:HupE / UreJ protein
MIRLLFALLLTALVVSTANAHERSRSNSSWIELEDGIAGRFYLDARQATLFLALTDDRVSLEAAFRDRLTDGIRINRGGAACDLAAPPSVTLLAEGRLEGRMRWNCPATGLVSIDIRVFAPLSANHLHFIRFENLETIAFEQILARGRTQAIFDPERADAPNGWLEFLQLGFQHILSGPDHIAFVLGLMLLVSGWRKLALVTLGFTIGHSITLALAITGWVSPPGVTVESLIGFSIVFVTAEAALNQTNQFGRAASIGSGLLLALWLFSAITGGALTWPVWVGLIMLTLFYFRWLEDGGDAQGTAPFVSAGFGLIHGVGFAGILLEVELEGGRLLPSLLAFNAGVEIGQLAIILIGTILLIIARQFVSPARLEFGRSVLIAALACVGTFWFLGRAFGV